MPLKNIHLTGKRPSGVPKLSATHAHKIVFDGSGWSNKNRTSSCDALGREDLLKRLASCSPTVRERAAAALSRSKDSCVLELLDRLESSDIDSRYGACEALISLRQRGAPAVDALRRQLSKPDLWLRIKSVEALAAIEAATEKPELIYLPAGSF